MSPEHHHDDGIIYQVNRGVQATYSNPEKRLKLLTINGKLVEDKDTYKFCVLEHQFKNSDYILDTPNEELTALAPAVVISTSARDVIEAYLCSHQHIKSEIEGRMKWI
jgi:5'-nucleotidase